jgi:hypothetical protein
MKSSEFIGFFKSNKPGILMTGQTAFLVKSKAHRDNVRKYTAYKYAYN